MEQVLVSKDMRIPNRQLKDLGFIKVKDRLYMKPIDSKTTLWRDYRNIQPMSYAYYRDRIIDHTNFKEHHAIKKIEEEMGIKT